MRIRRRRLLIASGLSGWSSLGRTASASQTTGFTDSEVLIGQSAILSGPLGVAVKVFNAGAGLAFADRMASGGVWGRRVRLISLDDGLKPDVAVANYKALLSEHGVLCFFGCVGSATVAAASGVLRESGAPLIGNFAVADSAREKAAGVAYFVRAPYSREAEKLVEHLGTIGITRFGAVHLANPGGVEVLKHIERAVAAQTGKSMPSAALQNDGSNVDVAARKLIEANPQAIVMFASGPPVIELMAKIVASGARPLFYGMSTVAGEAVAAALGERMRGLVVSSVVPYPWDAADPTAIRFRRLCASAGLAPTYGAYEGYINGLVLLEALNRAGRSPSRAGLHEVMRAMKLRFGAMNLDFHGAGAAGSRFVDIVSVTPAGRYVR